MLFKLAFRNILRQRRRTILTTISMAGGYLLSAMSFSMIDGSYSNVIRIFTEDETGHLQIHSKDYADKPRIYKTIDTLNVLNETLHAENHIKSFTPRTFAPALAYAEDNHAPVQVIGIDNELETDTSRLREKLASGQWLTAQPDSEGYFDALIGQGAATSLEIGVGDEIVLISQGADGSVANDLFRVKGTVGTRRSQERLNVYLPLQAAQPFLSLGPNQVHEIAIVLDDISLTDNIAAALTETLGRLVPDLTVSTWPEIQKTFYQSMQADKRSNAVTLGIILFIVFVGVLNTVLMSVLERTREFGMMKALGSRSSLVLTMILLETMLLATASIILGILIAIPVILWLTHSGFSLPDPVDLGGVPFSHMKGEFSARVMLLPAAIIYGYALAVSFLPGLRAARILPVEAMQTH